MYSAPREPTICEACANDHEHVCQVLAVELDTDTTYGYVPCECDCGGGAEAWAG